MIRFYRIFWLLLILSSFGSRIFAQSKVLQDVLYLKNNWILKGHVILNNTDSVKIITAAENIFAFPKSDVKLITQEAVKNNSQNSTQFYKRKGFENYTELGPLASKNTSSINVNTSAFSFQTVNGYKFSPLLYLGIGIGVDLYATQTFAPLFASWRGEFETKKNGTVVPFYFLDGGYGFNTTSYQNSPIQGKGGLLFALGGGVKINFNKASGFLLSLGYRVQNVSETELKTGVIKDTKYQRLALRAGFYF
jgi:hypothetical protein